MWRSRLIHAMPGSADICTRELRFSQHPEKLSSSHSTLRSGGQYAMNPFRHNRGKDQKIGVVEHGWFAPINCEEAKIYRMHAYAVTDISPEIVLQSYRDCHWEIHRGRTTWFSQLLDINPPKPRFGHSRYCRYSVYPMNYLTLRWRNDLNQYEMINE